MAIKLTKRKGFNFFRSYYDVYNELEKPEDKLAFIDALLDRQFLGIKPTNLKGMAKFAYISQTNSIDSQVKGYEDKTGVILTPTEGGCVGGTATPATQVKEKVQVQVKEKEKVQKEIDNILMSEIKISDDRKFLLFKDSQIESEDLVKHFDIANKFRLLFIKNCLDRNVPTTHQANAKFKSYVDPIRKIFEIDKVTKEQLGEAYQYLNHEKGEFWKGNIFSTSKLREKLPQILLKKNEPKKQNPKNY